MAQKVVVAWGSFDGNLHPGHLNFLKTCKKYGDKLVVFLSGDIDIRRQKSREPIYPAEVRRDNLLRTGLVNDVIVSKGDIDFNILQTLKLKPDVYCFGGDQTSSWNTDLETKLRGIGTEIVRIPRYKDYSTTSLYFSSQRAPRK